MTGFFLGGALAGFRHVDAGIGDETDEPGLDRVWDSQERQAAGDGVEGAGFGIGDAKSERRETSAWGLERFGNMLLIWLVRWRNGFGWRAGGSSFGAFVFTAKMGRFRPRCNLFLCDSGKAQGSKPLMGEG